MRKKGFCEARKEKDNSLIFRTLDVWKERAPTKEDVLLFVKLIVNKEGLKDQEETGVYWERLGKIST